jgi:ribose/xylose/arabinose/galactoside ABC-type transport system permease subunit
MSKGFLGIVKTGLMIAIVALAVIASLYVLDIFESEAVRQALVKLMSIIGIITGACLLLLLVGRIGSQEPPSS